MQESFLHYLWQMQYFDKRELKTTEGEKIEVFHPGLLNTDAGPDFSNGRIKIGPMDWVGSVEMHTLSSGWLDHHHEIDKAYENVILHVVWQEDKAIQRDDKTVIPTLELKGRVDETLLKKYRQLINSSFSIPCQRSLQNVNDLTKISMVEKALMQRLERKAKEVYGYYLQSGNNWEQTLFQIIGRNFGFKINAEPFFQLTRSLPIKIILKQADKQESIEALLFGQAGFLDASRGDEYYIKLQREHRLLTQKYDLHKSKMSKANWRFLRLRPANFPSLRLAQLGAILHERQNLFSHILNCESIKSLVRLFTVMPSPYWLNHYQFSKKSKSKVHELGLASIHNIIINTIVPVWVAYGKLNDDQSLIDRSLQILQQIPSESNRITRMWENTGITPCNSFDSQGVIELYNSFCNLRNCLSCNIGASLVRP